MSAQTIDYDALAKQAGAIQAVDYDALAKQAGSVGSTPPTSTPTGTISNAPTGAKAWLSNLEGDIRTGSTFTLPGKVLHAMGAPGTNAGTSPDVADTVASPILGPVHAAQGIVETPQHPVAGPLKAIGGVLQTATLPASFVAPEAAGKAIDKVADAIPTAERAGQNFQEVMGAAKKIPVSFENSQDAILKMVDWQKKTQLGPTINKFLNRVTNPNMGPMTYEEARDFYSLLGRLSADEQGRLAPPVRRTLIQMQEGLKTDVGNAAAKVGKAQQYYDAMKEFASAKKLEDLGDATKEVIMEALRRAIPYGVGTGIGAYGVKKILDANHQ